jgi:hypothetical protein
MKVDGGKGAQIEESSLKIPRDTTGYGYLRVVCSIRYDSFCFYDKHNAKAILSIHALGCWNSLLKYRMSLKKHWTQIDATIPLHKTEKTISLVSKIKHLYQIFILTKFCSEKL